MKSSPKAFQLVFPLMEPSVPATLEKRGAVYTKRWVVDLILDLAGYKPERNLVDALAIEPAAGDGAFLVPMVERLVASLRVQDRPIGDLLPSLRGFELSETTADAARRAVSATLLGLGVSRGDADVLTSAWIHSGDFLLSALHLGQADFVIGNPPYIRLEDIGSEVSAFYRDAYPTMTGRADIYIAFFEAALRLLRTEGVCAFICADRWMLNQYGAALRSLITASFSVETVVEMHAANAFAEDVSAYPAITILRNAPQERVVVAGLSETAQRAGGAKIARALYALRENGSETGDAAGIAGLRGVCVPTWFQRSEPWPCISPERLALLNRLEEQFDPLESDETDTVVSIGVATGADDVFIVQENGLVESDRLLPLALAQDTVSGTLEWSGHYLVDPWNETGLVDLADYPRLAAYMRKHEAVLRKRHVSKRRPRDWYRTIDRVNHHLTATHKLYIPDIKDRINPVLDIGATYPHHNLYVVHSAMWDLEVLGGILLSDVAQFFVSCYGVRMRGGYLRFQAQYLRRIRVPRPESLSTKQRQGLTDAFRARDVGKATAIALDVYGIDELPAEGS